MTELQSTIVAAARACLGTPFRHQGRSPGVALDCAGLAVVALKSAGVDIHAPANYSRTPHDGRLRAMIEIQRGLRFVPRDDMQAGDVLLIKIGNEPSHVGICAGDGNIIHAYEQVGKVVEHRLDAAWQAQIVAVYRAEVAQ